MPSAIWPERQKLVMPLSMPVCRTVSGMTILQPSSVKKVEYIG